MKPVLAILTQSIKRDNHLPLRFFKRIKPVHFYNQAPYGDLTKQELKNAIQYKGIFDLWRKLSEIRPNIIQGTEPYASRLAFCLSVLAYLYAKSKKIPLVFPVYENLEPEARLGSLQGKIAKWWLKIYAKKASGVFAVNRAAFKHLLSLGIKRNKIEYFIWGSWGIDTSEFRPRSTVDSQQLTVDARVSTILFIGRLVEEKGLLYLLQAFQEVRKEIKNARLLIAGQGPLAPLIQNIQGVDPVKAGFNGVEYLGMVKNKDLPPIIRSSQVLASPSITVPLWSEQLGMMNLQAMSCGVPVVSTYSGAIPEFVEDGKTGILVPEKNAEKLADALIKILKNKKLREKLGRTGRQKVLKDFNAKKNIERAEKILLSILEL